MSLSNMFRKSWYDYYTVITGVGLGAAIHFTNILVDTHQNIVCMYDRGKPKEIHPKIYLLFKEVLKDLEIPEKEQEDFKPFMFIGLDTYLIGSAYYRSGVRVGIPPTFAYDKVEEINAPKIYISNDTVDWSRPSAQTLLKTFIIPDEAKKFAIAREIISSQSADVFRSTLSPTIFFLLSHACYNRLYKSWNLVKRNSFLRFVVYSCCAAVNGTAWLYQDNYFTYNKEKKVNDILAKKGIEYVRGGYEFYNRILERNVAARVLMDEKSQKKITDRGEQKSYRYFFKQMRIAERRNFFAAKSRELFAAQGRGPAPGTLTTV